MLGGLNAKIKILLCYKPFLLLTKTIKNILAEIKYNYYMKIRNVALQTN